MEENKDLTQEKKKETAKGTTRKIVSKKATTSGTAKKTATKKTVKKETTGTTNKETSGTVMKKVTKKVAENPKVAERKKVEIPEKEQTKTVEIKKETEKPKFEPTKKVEKKKKYTILKAILMMIIAALVLFLMHFTRNYIIINNILTKQEELNKSTNYSLKIEHINENATLEYYHKDNVIMLVKDSNTGKVAIWSDKDKKESIFLNMKDLIATVNNEKIIDSFYDLKPHGIISDSEASRGFEFMYFITSEKVNGIDCYKVTWIIGGETAWYNKENGRVVRTAIKGQKEDYVTEYSNWKFNELTNEDMSRPNLMGYEVKTNQENQ